MFFVSIRARLSKYVEAQDAEASIKLIEYAFFKKVLERKRPTREPRLDDDEDSGHESEGEEVINPDATTKSNRKRSRKSNIDGKYIQLPSQSYFEDCSENSLMKGPCEAKLCWSATGMVFQSSKGQFYN